MEKLETRADESKVSGSLIDKSEIGGRTESILNKANKSMAKSVSFSFFGDDKFQMSEDTDMSVKTDITEENLMKKIYSNIPSSSDDTKPSNQSNNLSVKVIHSNAETSCTLTDPIEQYKDTAYFGWDGYQERYEDVTSSTNTFPQCSPPWAKTMQTKYGVSPLSSYSKGHQSKDEVDVKERIKQLMNKYNDLMLVKRVESKRQVIVEQGVKHGDIDGVKSKAMHTRYYIAPLRKSDSKRGGEENGCHTSENIEYSAIYSDNISLTKKTSKTQAKREVQGIVHSVVKKSLENNNYGNETKGQKKCQKLTASNIRDYVNAQSMTPDQRKLHEIIKIETVPSINNERREIGPSKYIINVPQNNLTDEATVNVIKIKEKRKLKVESIEDVRERTTELHYSKGNPQIQDAKLNRFPQDEKRTHVIGKTAKSPTETKKFQVTSMTTPHIAPLVETENNTDKVMLLQYEKKTAKGKLKDAEQSKYTTKLLGVRRPASDNDGEIYLYEAETCGEQQKEYTTKVEDVHPTLKEKLNSIFDEFRGLTKKKELLHDTIISVVQPKALQSDHSSQGPLEPIGTDVVSIQAMPDVKSVEIQVRESQILSAGFIAPHPSPHSGYIPDQFVETDERLEKTSKYLFAYADTRSESSDENIVENELFGEEETRTKEFDEDKQSLGPVKEELLTDIDRYEEKRLSEQSVEQTKSRKEDKGIDDKLIDDEQGKEDITSDIMLPLDSKLDDKSLSLQDKLDNTRYDVRASNESVHDADVSDGLEIGKDLTGPGRIDLVTDLKTADKSEDEQIEHKISTSKDQQTDDDNDDKVRVISVTHSQMPVATSKDSKGNEYHEREQSEEDIVRTLKGSHQGSHDMENIIDTSAIKIDDDIRSYNLDGFRDTKLTFTSPSKFLHKKNSIRKRLNWSDDTLYLEKHLCPLLVQGLAETAMHRPADPVAFLAHWIYKDYQRREQAELEAVHQEHRQLERAMCEIQCPGALVPKKFNLKKYPVKQWPSDNYSENEISVKAPTLESFDHGAIENEISQEA